MNGETKLYVCLSDDDNSWDICADEKGLDVIAHCLMYQDAERLVNCWNERSK